MKVSISLVRPIPQSKGFTYMPTSEAIPLRNIGAQTRGNAFVEKWISCYGISLKLTKDQGDQFELRLFTALNSNLGIHTIHTATYHPQSNSLVKRFHRQLKVSLRASCQGNNWVRKLPWVLFGIRLGLKEDIRYTSAQI